MCVCKGKTHPRPKTAEGMLWAVGCAVHLQL